MHCTTTELVVGAFVFLIIRAGEPILVSLFFMGAGRTGVPIFDIKPARETDILVRKMFHDIRVAGVLDAILLRSRGDVWDDRIVGGHEGGLKGSRDAR